MEHGLQISLKRYALSMEDKMAAGALAALRIMGETAPLTKSGGRVSAFRRNEMELQEKHKTRRGKTAKASTEKKKK